MPRMPTRRGRRPAPLKKKLKVAWELLINGRTEAEVARLHQVSRDTVRRWRAEILQSDEPEAIGLRRMMKKTG